MIKPSSRRGEKNVDPPGVSFSVRAILRSAWTWLVVLLFAVVGFALVFTAKLLVPAPGEHSAPTSASPVQMIKNVTQVAFDPRSGFPGKHRLNILVMGIDDNWTDQNILYTRHARTDTLFLLNLDLDNKKAGVLSFPRDSYVPIAGTNHSDKINSAYATGGPIRTVKTVANLIGIVPDYFVVLNIDATKRLVDALGGVDVNVEHRMDYDDNWGHLHIHLLPGYQHLDGNAALSFVRYRHGNRGLATEDGDPRRIYRQHVLLRSMIAKAKTLGSAFHGQQLVNTAMSCIDTNLSRTKIADLARIFEGIQQDNVVTAELDGQDARGSDGAWLVVLDPVQVKDYVNWIAKGDEPAVLAITPVNVKGGIGHPAVAAVDTLRSNGFVGALASTESQFRPVTTIVDTGVEDPHAARRIASILGVDSSHVIRRPSQPNKAGWTAPPEITVNLGQDLETSSSRLQP